MFKFFKKDPVPMTTAEQKLDEIKNLLFPEPEIQMEGDMEFYVDSSVDWNVEAVVIDIREGHVDEVCQKTLKNISERLFKARKLLQAYYERREDIKYVIVDDGLPSDHYE